MVRAAAILPGARGGCAALGVAPIEARISWVVIIPNARVTRSIPRDIFDKDILPS